MDDTPEGSSERSPRHSSQSALNFLADFTLARSAELARAYKSVFEATGPVGSEPATPNGAEQQGGDPHPNSLRGWPVELPNGRRGVIVVYRDGPERRYHGALVGEVSGLLDWRTVLAVLAAADTKTIRSEDVRPVLERRWAWLEAQESGEAGELPPVRRTL